MRSGKFWPALFLVVATAVTAGYLAGNAGLGTSGPVQPPLLPDSGRYQGEMRDGRYHGRGVMTWDSGARYAGEFANGLFSGHGRYEVAAGDVYEGQFHKGLPHGDGTLTTPNGEEFEGRFRAGQIVEGVYRDEEGRRYDGQFENWQFHGQGEFTDPNGNVYRGTFRNGGLEGSGIHEGPSGFRYEGEFKNHLYHGQGTVTWPGGRQFVGNFHEGQRNGAGQVLDASGEVVREGTWLQGVYLGGTTPERDAPLPAFERALYRQETLLEQAFDGLAAGKAGEIELYFVGVAPFGGQDVFRKEIEFIADQAGRYLEAENRTIVLGNHPEMLESYPLATKTSLRRTLEHVADLMNPEEDILFLYLTSHGTPQHELQTELPGADFPELDVEAIESILAGLPNHWKVVAISACYSGGFIEPLRNARTLVMTSARADRTSFGCGESSEMTYFGKALFREALPAELSLQAAFEKARELVREWEEEKEVEQHSEPQIAVGEGIARHLEKWRGPSDGMEE